MSYFTTGSRIVFAPFSLRAELLRLFRRLKDKGVSGVITGERGIGTALTRQGREEHISHCVIALDRQAEELTRAQEAESRQTEKDRKRGALEAQTAAASAQDRRRPGQHRARADRVGPAAAQIGDAGVS